MENMHSVSITEIYISSFICRNKKVVQEIGNESFPINSQLIPGPPAFFCPKHDLPSVVIMLLLFFGSMSYAVKYVLYIKADTLKLNSFTRCKWFLN